MASHVRTLFLTMVVLRFACICVCVFWGRRGGGRHQDEFYFRYIIKNSLFDPIMTAFVANGRRYNLLNSAVIEMVDFIRKVR